MLGLLEKDLRLTLSRKQSLVIFFVMALFMGMSMDGSFILAYLTMFATIMAVGTISYDEYDNGFAFLMTLPFDRKTYVKEKYLFCLLMAIAAWCVGMVMYFIVSMIRQDSIMLSGELPMLLAFIPVLYLSAAVMIPLQLKYGQEKSRIVLFVIFGLIAALVVIGQKATGSSDGAPEGLVRFLDSMSPVIVLLALTGICVLAACISCLLSIRIMEKKEF